jgi:hypothetical protein
MNSYDYFGVSVRVGHRTLVVGAFGENAVAINSGSAFVYDRTASSIWTLKAKLISSDAAGDDLFGTVVDIGKNDTLIAVTTYRDDGQRGNSASLTIFDSSRFCLFIRKDLEQMDSNNKDHGC